MRILIISGQQNFRQQTQAACLLFKDFIVSLRTAESVGQGLEFAEQFEAQIVFIDLTKNIEAGLIAISKLSAVPNRIVVASVDKSSTDVLTRMVRMGAREILSQPIQDEEIHEIIKKSHKIINDISSTQPERTGKVLICFSSKGGVGKTTLACNLAMILNQRYGEGNVALIDANTQAPNITPMLDLRPQRWLRDAILEYKRLDTELLKELMTIHQETGLHVLAHNTENPLGLEFSEDQLDKILLVSKGTYEWTVVDTFPLLSSLNLSMMDLADEIFLVTEPIVPSLRSAKHNLDMLERAGYGSNKISLVLNKYSEFEGNVSADTVSEILNMPVRATIPYDVHSTISANNGKPLAIAYPRLLVSRAIERFVDDITNQKSDELADETTLDKLINQTKKWLNL